MSSFSQLMKRNSFLDSAVQSKLANPCRIDITRATSLVVIVVFRFRSSSSPWIGRVAKEDHYQAPPGRTITCPGPWYRAFASVYVRVGGWVSLFRDFELVLFVNFREREREREIMGTAASVPRFGRIHSSETHRFFFCAGQNIFAGTALVAA